MQKIKVFGGFMSKNGVRIRIGLVLLLMLLPLMAGCGAFRDQSAPAAATEAKAATEKPSAKTIIVYARGMDDTKATARLLEAYNAQSETVTVKYQELAADTKQRYAQMVSSLEEDEVEFDVFDAEIVWPAEFAKRGFAAQMDEHVEQAAMDMSVFFPGTVAALTYQDALWGIPKTASAGVLYYRLDLMNEAPSSWAALLSIAETQSLAPYGFAANGAANDSLVSVALEFIYAYGGRVLDENGQVTVNSPEAAKGLDAMRKLYTSEAVPPNMLAMTDNDAYAMFLSGESAMMRNWPYAWAHRAQAASSVSGKFAIAPLPAGDAGASSVMGGVVLMMNAKSEKADAVWDFMQFVASKEGQAILAVHGGRVPARRDVMQMPEVLVSNPHFCEQNFVRAIEEAVPRAVTPYYTRISAAMQEELERFLRMEMDAAAAASNMEIRIKLILGEE